MNTSPLSELKDALDVFNEQARALQAMTHRLTALMTDAQSPAGQENERDALATCPVAVQERTQGQGRVDRQSVPGRPPGNRRM
jgi:hypothetical protein